MIVFAAPSGRANAARRTAPTVDPVGTWNCVVYGHPDFGDERVVMNFSADGALSSARQTDDAKPQWARLSGWTATDGALAFRDPRSGRQFEADLHRATLGGSWRTPSLVGGWWCSAVDPQTLPVVVAPFAPAPAMPPLIPIVTATPWYPLQAIREAKQGHAVTCFLVGADGQIVKPDVVELSDEIFREPILMALERSRYQGWDDDRVLRPGCRTYVFKLDALNQ